MKVPTAETGRVRRGASGSSLEAAELFTSPIILIRVKFARLIGERGERDRERTRASKRERVCFAVCGFEGGNDSGM